MGYFSSRRAATKAIGDPGNDFGGALSQILFGGGLSAGGRTTAELLGATASSPWPHLATVLIAIREAEARYELLRPGLRVIEEATNSKGQLIGVRWKAGGKAQHQITKSRVLHAAVSKRGLQDRREEIDDFKTMGFLTEQQDHPFLDMVRSGTMREENPLLQLSGFEVASLFSTTRQAVGEFYYLLDRRGTPVPRSWIPIPPHWVTPPTSSDRNYRVTFGSVDHLSSRMRGLKDRPIPPEDIAAYRRPNPVNPFRRGAGSMNAIDHDVVIDENAAKHMGATLANRAVPALLMVIAGLQPHDKLRLEEEWRSELTGPGRAGQTKFLKTPQGFDILKNLFVQELQTSPHNLEMSEVRRHQRDLSLEVSQVPPLIAGVHESGNRAMAQVAEELMQLNAVGPALAAAAAFYQSRFFEPFGGNPAEYQGGFILTWQAPEQIDDTSRNQMMRIQGHHFSRAQFLKVSGERARPGDEFTYFIPNAGTLIDSRTNQPIFTAPVSANPFGAGSEPGEAKFVDIEERLDELEALVA